MHSFRWTFTADINVSQLQLNIGTSSLTERLLMKPTMDSITESAAVRTLTRSTDRAEMFGNSRGGSSGNNSLHGSSPQEHLAAKSVNLSSRSIHTPITLAGATANAAGFRQVVSSSAPTSTFDMEAFIRRGSSSGSGGGSGQGGGTEFSGYAEDYSIARL